jgi:hypothetical protein
MTRSWSEKKVHCEGMAEDSRMIIDKTVDEKKYRMDEIFEW